MTSDKNCVGLTYIDIQIVCWGSEFGLSETIKFVW